MMRGRAVLAAFVLPIALITGGAEVPSGFEPVGVDIVGDQPGDAFGEALAVSANGNRLAIGSPGADDARGLVRVLDWNGVGWQRAGADILGDDGGIAEFGTGDRFGTSIAISADGNRIAVSARSNPDVGRSSGYVRILDWDGTSWTRAGPDLQPTAADGADVALSGDGTRVVIGGDRRVQVHDWDGSAWSQLGTDITTEVGDLAFGAAVASDSDGSRVLAGAPSAVDPESVTGASEPGRALVHDWTGSEWAKTGPDIGSEAGQAYLGTAVASSADGTRIAVGAPGGIGPQPGIVGVYDWDGTVWTQVGPDLDVVTPPGGGFASVSIALSADGARLVVGRANAGRVRVHDWDGSTWTQVGQDLVTDGLFGAAVAVAAEGDRIAHRAGVDSSGAGIVRVVDVVVVDDPVDSSTTSTTPAPGTTAPAPIERLPETGRGSVPVSSLVALGVLTAGVSVLAAARRRTGDRPR